MKYKRTPNVFTLYRIILQVCEYYREQKEMPKKIILPAEEYFMVSYLLPNGDITKQATEFVGIPLEPTYENQEQSFMGI